MGKQRIRSYNNSELAYNKIWNELIQSRDAQAFYNRSDVDKATRFVHQIGNFLVRACSDASLRDLYQRETKEACQEILDLYRRDYLGRQGRESDFFEEPQSGASEGDTSEDDAFEDDSSEYAGSEGEESTASGLVSEAGFGDAESAMEVDADRILTAACCAFFKTPGELGLLPEAPDRIDNLCGDGDFELTEDKARWLDTMLASGSGT